MKLSEQKVLVIGGSSGMGLAIAGAAAQAEADVMIASRSEERLQQAVGKIGSGVKWLKVDFTDEASVRNLFTAVGPVDHLVIPGSAVKTGPLKEIPLTDAKSSMDSKFFGPYLAVKEAEIKPRGSIILFSGILKPIVFKLSLCFNMIVN